MVELPEGRKWDMLVFDVDGTLMDANGYHPELIPLIREVEARGLTVSLASGRTLPNVTPIKQSLGVSGFIVAENGGMVWDSAEGREIVALADGSEGGEDEAKQEAPLQPMRSAASPTSRAQSVTGGGQVTKLSRTLGARGP